MDMREPLAYFESALNYCEAMERDIDREILKLESKKTVYTELRWKLESALDKEKKKASGEIEY